MPYKNKEDQAKAAKRHYEKNRIKINKRSKERKARIRQENKQKLWDYLLSKSCIDCGETNPIVLQFDHFRDKKLNVSDLIGGGYRWETIFDEIQKCDIRCANCHLIKTAKDFNWYSDISTK